MVNGCPICGIREDLAGRLPVARPGRPPGPALPGRLRDGSHHAEHRAALSRAAKAGYIAGTVAVVAMVVASLGAYAVYRKLDGNISTVKVSGLSHRSVYGAQNILVLGSQTRQGQRAGDLGSNPALNTSNSGGDFAGVNPPAAAHSGTGKGKAGRTAASSSPAAQTTVQSRNAGASICSGLPQANPNPGVP